MRLPIIKSLVDFAQKNDQDYLIETEEVLESLVSAKGIKDEEIEVIAELMSNISGALEVNKQIKNGTPQKEALNNFMQRVLGSIGR